MSATVSHSLKSSRLKYVVALRRTRTEDRHDDRPYIGLENIESSTGRLIGDPSMIEQSNYSESEDLDSLCNTFEPGDVLFGKLRPYLAKAWLATFTGRCTTELLVFQPKNVKSDFLRYVCLSRDFVEAVNASTFGSKMPRADWDFIGNMTIPIPEVSRQSTIVDYLDRETARLDALVAAKKQVLDLLAEKRRALITHAVTRGLDSSVPLRDSGIPWLGMIPAHWKHEKIAWLFRERDQRGEADLPLLEVSINEGVILREFSSDKIESTAADFNTYKIARCGDIVFNKMRMWQGAVGVAPEDGLVSPDYVVAEPKGPLSSRFAGQLFRTAMFSAECARQSHGIVWDRMRLYWDGFRDIMVPLPSLEEQTRIMDDLTTQLAKLDEVFEVTGRSIHLLKERRSSLIAAAVAGQIDVGAA